MTTIAVEDVLESEAWDQDELSEMKSLLQRAEQRIRKLNPASKYATKTTTSSKYARPLIISCHRLNFLPRLPKLNPGPIAKPYIDSIHSIARTDRTRLATSKDRQITARRVEDPKKVKERIKEVGYVACFLRFRL